MLGRVALVTIVVAQLMTPFKHWADSDGLCFPKWSPGSRCCCVVRSRDGGGRQRLAHDMKSFHSPLMDSSSAQLPVLTVITCACIYCVTVNDFRTSYLTLCIAVRRVCIHILFAIYDTQDRRKQFKVAFEMLKSLWNWLLLVVMVIWDH